jgi:hypothetical protein
VSENLVTLRNTLGLIDTMKAEFGVRPTPENSQPLLFTGVAESVVIEHLTERVAEHFGPPYKAAHQGAFFMNLFDGFVKAVGGVNRDQTLFRKDFEDGVTLYCAFWPWGSNPVKTSVRLGLLCRSHTRRRDLEREFAKEFR